MPDLTLKTIQEAIAGTAAAFRCRTEYQPAGGENTPVFPPTYEGGKYAAVGTREENGRRLADQVVLDSVQSQANRMELALQDAWEAGRITLPVITVDFTGSDLEKEFRVTSLEAPHRIADAILRDSVIKETKTPFRKSEDGRKLDHVDIRNATALFELCPTALVFGLWDSTGPKGGLGAKFQRAIVSEIVGLNVQFGVKTASRIDPLQTKLGAGPLYQSDDDIGWTLDEARARKERGKPQLRGKDGRPSEANHGNVTPSFAEGGALIQKALQTTVLSLAALRRLRFPIANGKDVNKDVNAAAQTALAALGICAAALTREAGCDLRSRCQLFPMQKIVWELLDLPGDEPKQYTVTGRQSMEIFTEAVKAATDAGLPWRAAGLQLEPSEQLSALVRKSQLLAASAGPEEGT